MHLAATSMDATVDSALSLLQEVADELGHRAVAFAPAFQVRRIQGFGQRAGAMTLPP